ncbi:MAG: hypothetical protein ACAH88_10605 [Roseimicrobium sp.]
MSTGSMVWEVESTGRPCSFRRVRRHHGIRPLSPEALADRAERWVRWGGVEGSTGGGGMGLDTVGASAEVTSRKFRCSKESTPPP